MRVDTSADEIGLVSPDRVRLLVQGLLRGAQASGWTDDSLGAATGLSARRIKSYRVEGKEPSLSAALSIGVVLGTSAINGLLATIGYVARPLDEAEDACVRMLAADAMGHLAVIARNAADGRIDHTEEAETRLAADALIATVLPLASAGGAA
ncbi:hypothetical protein [Sphingomonas baiyangensis]|uniref:Uncharacterized protein n=1 Tax=Sphingomonas baiyangensis TaxID=2572576 RepID=A0A4U1L0D1_9SPHN|nr:hypothetical protein [Sphingomonas baiyangensis]TKD50201.1 hypothetical protein FBR43_05105 [Sphingomonas baiyangensis]